MVPILTPNAEKDYYPQNKIIMSSEQSEMQNISLKMTTGKTLKTHKSKKKTTMKNPTVKTTPAIKTNNDCCQHNKKEN